MFQEIKDEVTIVDAYQAYLGENAPLKSTGGTTFIPDDDVCPWHGGHGSFRIFFDEADPSNGYAKCFAPCEFDDRPADVIEFTRRTFNLATAYEAAVKLITDFELKIPLGNSAHQRIFYEAAEYFQNLFMTTKNYPYLEGKTPRLYQLENRQHKPETLDRLRIGWTDGQLHKHLLSKGFTREEVVNSGLVKSAVDNRIWDTFPEGSFMYTHYDHGRPSKFTMKCMSKSRAFQLNKEFALNDATFYGQEDLGYNKIAIVEGENDRAALYDAGWDGGVLASIGQLSQAQLKWISDKLREKELYTFFDNDDAGNTYRQKVWMLLKNESVTNVRQFAHPDYKDIDLVIRSEGVDGLARTLESFEVVRPSVEEYSDGAEERILGSGEIIERDGCYYASKLIACGSGEMKEILTNITNFTIEITHTYFYNHSQRIRNAILRNANGTASNCVISSEVKTNMNKFNCLIADTIDGIFRGNNNDFNNLWIYLSKKYPERLVSVPDRVGHVPEYGGWIFGNVYVSKSGRVVTPDSSGIMWIDNDNGICPVSIAQSQGEGLAGMFRDTTLIPKLGLTIPTAERGLFEEAEGSLLRAMADCLGDKGKALTIMAWSRMHAISDDIFNHFEFVPQIVFWGRAGKGKTTWLKWLLKMWGLNDKQGYFAYSTLKSGVGLNRKSAYYSSLPLVVDELRADEHLNAFSNRVRELFNRTPITQGTTEAKVVRITPVVANFAFAGQDNFTDAATKQRCIPVEIMNQNSNEHKSGYRAICEIERSKVMQCMGLHWLLESTDWDIPKICEEMDYLSDVINSRLDMPENRMANLWAILSWFGIRYAEKYMPDFDYLEYAVKAADDHSADNQEVDILVHFWDSVRILQSQAFAKVDSRHLLVKNNKMYVYFSYLYNQVSNDRVNQSSGVLHSRSAIRKTIEAEHYYEGSTAIRMGDGATQRCLTIRLDENTPTIIKEIAEKAAMMTYIG